jgi:integrase
MPARRKLERGHHAALAYAAVPQMMAALRQSSGVAARCVEFVTLTAARSGEARGATFSEIDKEARTWTVPAARMKAGKEHVVPLCARALEIIEAMRQRATSDLIFGGGVDGRPISDTAMTKALRLASPDKAATLHGLRSSFRDWAGDTTGFEREIAEGCLAHTVGNAVELAYRRSTALEKRRELLDAWATYCGRGDGR